MSQQNSIDVWSNAQTMCDCGHLSNPSEYSTGYGTDCEGKTKCYECCADDDKQHMIDHGKTDLYLVQHEGPNGLQAMYVTNWPGTLRFKVQGQTKGRHNIAGVRYDVWFLGPDKHIWHGVQYGNNTQIAHCKRTKERAA